MEKPYRNNGGSNRSKVSVQNIRGNGMTMRSRSHDVQESSFNVGKAKRELENKVVHELGLFSKNASEFFQTVDKVQDPTNKKLYLLHCKTDEYELYINPNVINEKSAIVKFEFLKHGMPQSLSSLDIRGLIECDSGHYGVDISQMPLLLNWCRKKISNIAIRQEQEIIGSKIQNMIE